MKKVSIAATKQSKNVSEQKLTIGLDLGDRSSWYCVLDEGGAIVLEQKLGTTPKAMKEVDSLNNGNQKRKRNKEALPSPDPAGFSENGQGARLRSWFRETSGEQLPDRTVRSRSEGEGSRTLATCISSLLSKAVSFGNNTRSGLPPPCGHWGEVRSRTADKVLWSTAPIKAKNQCGGHVLSPSKGH